MGGDSTLEQFVQFWLYFFCSASRPLVCVPIVGSLFISLVQVSRWKSRTEELENLQRMASSPERSAFDGSNSEMEASQSTNPIEPLLSPRVEDGAPLGTLDPVPAPHQQQKEEPKELERDKAATNALRQELSEAKENLAMMEEEVAAAVLAAREQAVKRVAAESRVGSLQVREAEALSGGRGGEVEVGVNYDDAI